MNNVYSTRTEDSTDEWETPQYFFDLLDKEFQFTLDPAASHKSAKCKKYYTKEENGLMYSWEGETVFLNPPFSDNEIWLAKSYSEALYPNTKIVVIMPSRTDTKYWHKFVMKADEIRFVKGRVDFLKDGEVGSGANFPLVIVVFDKVSGNPKVSSYYHKEKDLEQLNITNDEII